MQFKQQKRYHDKELYQWTTGKDKLYVPEFPTFYTTNINKQPRYIDLCLTKNTQIPKGPFFITLSDSDHNPIVAELVLNNRTLSNLNKHLDYEKANWNTFASITDQRLCNMHVNEAPALLKENVYRCNR